MKTVVAASAMILATLTALQPAQAQVGQVAKAIASAGLKAVGSRAVPIAIGAAAGATAVAAINWDELNKRSGYDGQNAIYSLGFNTMGGQGYFGYFFGARTFGRPDVFLLIEIEGIGRYVVPHVNKDYAGQPILETIFLNEIPDGRKVLINVYDDRSTSDKFWNDLLSQPVNYSGKIGIESLLSTQWGRIALKGEFKGDLNAEVNGKFQLVGRNLEIVRPTWICSAEFVTPTRKTHIIPGKTFMWIPYEQDKKVVQPWKANASFMDTKGKTAGSITLTLVEVRS